MSSPTSRARRSGWRPSPRARRAGAGDEFTITTEDVPGDKTICGTTYKGLPGDVAKGDQVLINDGNVELKVTEVDGPG